MTQEIRRSGTGGERSSVQRAFCTTREAAQILGVSLRTAQLWSESGLLEAWKTTGGHRRISRQSVERLLATPGSRAPAAPVAASQPPAAKQDSRFSILVVEDEEDLRRVYEIVLSRWPMQPRVVAVADGYAALVRIGIERPDMVITDLHMPGMNGFEMIRSLRAQPELRDMQIVVVTGLDANEIDDRGGIPADIPVLPKPIPFDQLSDIALRAAARSRHSGQQQSKGNPR
ncbi:MAG: response regulator [Rhodocyclaceae bacterium]|jgi:excisionase family DNA binding protein|nr:response regulator [Rhodocyclaceae bacterium]